MGAIPPRLLIHEATIEPLTGEGPFGRTFGPATPVACRRQDGRRLVRDANGDEVVSSTTLRMAPTEVCPAGSQVTLDDGTVTTAIAAARRLGGRGPVDHLEVALT